ncbi:uncharacterized protein LOC142416360 [Mycteria americana]|uniref:uncharacterized protein LOC142416360 n=1 Tax=Mycteria americana TaxID=33587 RepID=UPI003F581357
MHGQIILCLCTEEALHLPVEHLVLCFPCRLGQGFLEAFKSSRELAAGGRGVPVPCRLLPPSLPDHAHPCFETCLHQPCFPPLSHPPAPFQWSPSSSAPKPAPTPCRPHGFAGNRTCASSYLRLDAAGHVPAGTTAAALLPVRSGCLPHSARVQAAGRNQRSWLEKIWAEAREKKSWDLASSYTSFHEKSNVAITGPRLCWSPPRPLPGSAALPMPTQRSAESRPSLVPCPRLRRLREPLLPLPPPPAGGDGSQTPGELTASCCSRDIFIAITALEPGSGNSCQASRLVFIF